MKFETLFKITWVMIVIGRVLLIGILGLVLYVAWHFISRYW